MSNNAKEIEKAAEAYSTTAIVNRCVKAADSSVLIEELRRRGRLRLLDTSVMLYSEMTGDKGYMEHIDKVLGRRLIEGLGEAMLTEDRPYDDRHRVKTASVVVLVSEAAAKQLDTTESLG